MQGKVLGSLLAHRYALAAFLIPLGIRAAPEIIVGPYPVGFDTIAFYVADTLNSPGRNKYTYVHVSTHGP